MKGVHKQFSTSLYDEFDGPAKEAMRNHLELSGHTVDVPPENYGVDLSSSYLDVVMYHEVEVSMNWQAKEFPFPTGSIPERKIRLVREHTNEPLFFWRLRTDLKRALVYSAAHLCEEWLVNVSNIYNPDGGEFFYRPPVSLGKEFDMLCQ